MIFYAIIDNIEALLAKKSVMGIKKTIMHLKDLTYEKTNAAIRQLPDADIDRLPTGVEKAIDTCMDGTTPDLWGSIDTVVARMGESGHANFASAAGANVNAQVCAAILQMVCKAAKALDDDRMFHDDRVWTLVAERWRHAMRVIAEYKGLGHDDDDYLGQINKAHRVVECITPSTLKALLLKAVVAEKAGLILAAARYPSPIEVA